MANDKEAMAAQLIARTLDMVDAAFRGGMVPTTYGDLAALSSEVIASAYRWDNFWFFEPASSPHGGNISDLSVYYCVGQRRTQDRPGSADMVRFDYTHEGNPITVVNTPRFTLTLLPGTGKALAAMDPPTRLLALRKLAGQVFKSVGKYAWQPRPPAPAEDGIGFTTGPDKRPFTVAWWDQRMDAGVWQGHVYFLLYRQMDDTTFTPHPRFFKHLDADTP